MVIGAHAPFLAGCGSDAQTVPEASGDYDAIIVGGGSAGTIVAAKLHNASGGRKRILMIDAGGPTSAAIGGTDYPSWVPPDRTDLAIFDGRPLFANRVSAARRTLSATQTGFTFQGIGLGGNSMYNGMLFQTNSPQLFDASWPAGWDWAAMQPYFNLVRQHVPGDEHALYRRPAAEYRTRTNSPSALCRCGLGRSRHQPAVPRRRGL